MNKLWKYVLIVALVLAVGGALLGGVGLLTGASLDRILTAVRGLEGLRAAADTLWQDCLALLRF